MKNKVCVAIVLLITIFPVSGCAADPVAENLAPTKVLVFGGTGRLGSEIASALLDAGHQVIVFARPGSDRRRLQGLDIDFVLGDVLESAQVDAGLIKAQPSVVVDALGRSGAPVEFYADSARNIAQASASHGVSQIILHGSVGAGDSVEVLRKPLSDRTQRLYGAKSAGERAVRESGVNFTIIRHWQLLRAGTPASGKAVLSSSQTATGAVSRADLALLTLKCVSHTPCFDQIYHAVQSTQ